MPNGRRAFLAALTAALARCASAPKWARRPKILVRSGWQTVNIGDIAHTPGLLRLLQDHVPQADVILWSNGMDRGVAEMLRRRFAGIQIMTGDIGEDGEPDNSSLADTFEQADFMLHGSGPSVVARDHLAAWRKRTGKPYGIFGVTITLHDEAASSSLDPDLLDLLNAAEFVYTRETASLANLEQAGVHGPDLGFCPDAAFSFDMRDEGRSVNFLSQNGLGPNSFIAVVPRLRLTPYHRIREVNWTQDEIDRRERINAEHAETDHAKLRQAIVRWVRETGGKALLCPEMTYETDIIDPLLFNPLPDDVKPSVVRRHEFWLPDEAASVYARAVTVVSCECHSPILAAVQGTPCMYVHQPEDGIKGQMWNDIGLGDWYLQIEETTGDEIAEKLLAIRADPRAAADTVRKAVAGAQAIQATRVQSVVNALSKKKT